MKVDRKEQRDCKGNEFECQEMERAFLVYGPSNIRQVKIGTFSVKN